MIRYTESFLDYKPLQGLAFAPTQTQRGFRRMSRDDVNQYKGASPSKPISSGSYNSFANFHRDLLAGALMGGVVHTIVAPIERAKLLLQTQESNIAIVGGTGRRRFKGMFDCIVRTVKDEGILSLWRGNGSSVLRYYPSVALNFSLKVFSFSLFFILIVNCPISILEFLLMIKHSPSSNYMTIFFNLS